MRDSATARPTRVLGMRFLGWFFVIGLATFAVHEGAHWLVGELLGYEMIVRPNRASSTTPMTVVHATLTDAAGPAVTIVTALVAFVWVRRTRSIIAFGVLYLAAFMRVLAAAVSFFHPNDEARISMTLGLGAWTLPLAVAAGLVALTWVASRLVRLSWRDHLSAYAVASLVATVVVGVDSMLPR